MGAAFGAGGPAAVAALGLDTAGGTAGVIAARAGISVASNFGAGAVGAAAGNYAGGQPFNATKDAEIAIIPGTRY